MIPDYEDYEEVDDDQVEEFIAFSSPDWDGTLEDGVITDEGTCGWCITRSGEAIIHANEPVVIHSVTRPKEPIMLRVYDVITTGVLAQN